jgi:hypothetical protein
MINSVRREALGVRRAILWLLEDPERPVVLVLVAVFAIAVALGWIK